MSSVTEEKKRAGLKQFKPGGAWPEGALLYTDEYKVRLFLKVEGEVPCDGSEVIDALAAIDVRNVDTEAVFSGVMGGNNGEPVLVAAGQPPEHGEHGRVEYKFEMNDGSGGSHERFKEDDFGRVDFRALDNIVQVEEGQVLAEAFPPTSGKPGVDVFGNAVEPEPGAPARLDARIGRNVTVSEDGAKAIAALSGHVTFVKDKMCVSSIYKVSGDVDYEVGNIEFNGDVVVLGCVREDFRIEAAGSVEVAKNVERATIIAGGNVEVGGGILGKESTEVLAGQDIVASYANHASLKAGHNIIVSDEMVHTAAYASNVLVHRGRGAVLGGEINATETINIRVAGDENSGIHTLLNVEHDRELKQGIRDKEEEFDTIRAELIKVKESYDRMIELRDRQGGSLGKSAQKNLARIADEVRTLAVSAKTVKTEIEEMEGKLSTADQVKIVVQEKLLPGVRLTIFERERRVVDSMEGGLFMIVGGGIEQVR